MSGGFFTIVGATWFAMSDSKDKIIKLQGKAISQITLGTSWCYLWGGLMKQIKGDSISNYPSIYSIQVKGKIPLYNLSVRDLCH